MTAPVEARPVAVVDTNVLLNLATPVVDGRDRAPTGGDPLRAVLTAYDVHVPATVVGEATEASRGDDLLAAAATLITRAADHLTTHDVPTEGQESLDLGLDPGETYGIVLANELSAPMFATDEFNSTNYLLVSLGLADRNALFTTPHVLCVLAEHDVLDERYVTEALTYYVETKGWDRQYVESLRERYCSE